MSDVHHPARDDARDGRTVDGPTTHLTLSPTGPQRPETGSALERVLRRQAVVPGRGGLLGFVPAQVR